MRFILSLLLTLSASAFLNACQSVRTAKMELSGMTAMTTPTPPTNANTNQKTPDPAKDAPRISLADAKKDFDTRNAVFVDSRSESSYKKERIKGAISLPMEAFEMRYKEIPTDKKIIVYCS